MVQIDGRVRGRAELDAGTCESDAVTAAREVVSHLIADRPVRRVVFVPDKVVNFVTE